MQFVHLRLAIGGVLMPSQSALMWKAACIIERKRGPLFVLLGPVAIGAAGPILRSLSSLVSLAAGAVYALATAAVLWSGRRERLAARWPLIILTAGHGLALIIGTYSTFIGSTGEDAVPAIMSLFGFIYFESIIFALGTSVFVFAMVKERSEAVSMAAARTDPLTGIANRAAFLASAERMLQRCEHDDTPAAVIMFDLDHFKAVNDRYGHSVGDAVIKQFCDVVVAALRPTDLFGRMGGEEFVAMLPGSSVEVACLRAERIRLTFGEECRFVRGHRVNATVSGGVATRLPGAQTLEVVLEEADATLYRAKSEGRNRISRADRAPSAAVVATVHLVA